MATAPSWGGKRNPGPRAGVEKATDSEARLIPATLAVSLLLTAEPALVELFSSEGCSSCPPAESLLRSQAADDPSIVALEFHVDYWNGLGWQDPFSSADFSERQSRYAQWRGTQQVYTPQAVVDGREAFVGSDSTELRTAVQRARGAGKSALILHPKDETVEISATNAPAGELWVAISESGLETSVQRGENRGRTLHHAPLGRRFSSLGVIAGGPLQRAIPLELDRRWHRQNLTVVAAVQDPASGRITALGSAPLLGAVRASQ
jgi:hypothetical protein